MLVLAAIVLTLAVAAVILSPFVGHVAAPLTDGPDLLARLRDLHALKGVAYETLQDIEFDYHAGKIGERDGLLQEARRPAVDGVRGRDRDVVIQRVQGTVAGLLFDVGK